MRKYHYNVLATTVPRQDDLCRLLRNYLPDDRGVVFCPMMETYRRGRAEDLVLKPLFPGYVFIRSDLKATELHELITHHRRDIMTYIGEIGHRRRLASGEFGSHTTYEDGEVEIPDLSDSEAAFLDILLDFDRTGGEVDFGTVMQIHKKDPTAAVAALVPRGKPKSNGKPESDIVTESETSAAGLLRMSYGYKDPKKKRWIVMEGPLRAFENHIKDVNTHNKKAYLDFEINGHVVRAGFDAKPKKYWFPEDEEASDILEDGTEIDIEKLKRSMTSLKRRKR